MRDRPTTLTAVQRLESLLSRRPSSAAVLRLLCEGLSRKEIASQLGLSAHTVDWHLRSLYRDVGVNSALSLVRAYERAIQLSANVPPLIRWLARGGKTHKTGVAFQIRVTLSQIRA